MKEHFGVGGIGDRFVEIERKFDLFFRPLPLHHQDHVAELFGQVELLAVGNEALAFEFGEQKYPGRHPGQAVARLGDDPDILGALRIGERGIGKGSILAIVS